MVAYLEHLQNSDCLGPADYEHVKKGTGPQTFRCTKFYCEEVEFKRCYKEFCNRNGFDSSEHAYSRALYQSPFGKLNITIKKATYEHWPPYENNNGVEVRGPLQRRSFLYGVWTYEHGLPWKFKDNGFIQQQHMPLSIVHSCHCVIPCIQFFETESNKKQEKLLLKKG